MRDVWSNDPDRTTRRGDTRTSEQITAETFPAHWCEYPNPLSAHSGDRVTVYRGGEPQTWCGYHASMI